MTYRQQENSSAVVLSPRGEARASVIWLHGLGADGFDFVPIVEELQVEALAIRFVFPHAAMRPVTINNGFVMRAWYDIKGLTQESAEDEAGVRESAALVERFIADEIAQGAPAERIILAGFSQGGAMALHTALRHSQRLAGVLALSTYLPLRAALASEAAEANRRTPILMCHGLHDDVLPASLGAASRDALQSLGYRVQWRTYPMAHQVSLDEIRDIAAWLKATLQETT